MRTKLAAGQLFLACLNDIGGQFQIFSFVNNLVMIFPPHEVIKNAS